MTEKAKLWLFQGMEKARCDMHEARQGYEWRKASEKYGYYCEIVAELGLMDEYWKGEWNEER